MMWAIVIGSVWFVVGSLVLERAAMIHPNGRALAIAVIWPVAAVALVMDRFRR